MATTVDAIADRLHAAGSRQRARQRAVHHDLIERAVAGSGVERIEVAARVELLVGRVLQRPLDERVQLAQEVHHRVLRTAGADIEQVDRIPLSDEDELLDQVEEMDLGDDEPEAGDVLSMEEDDLDELLEGLDDLLAAV